MKLIKLSFLIVFGLILAIFIFCTVCEEEKEPTLQKPLSKEKMAVKNIEQIHEILNDYGIIENAFNNSQSVNDPLWDAMLEAYERRGDVKVITPEGKMKKGAKQIVNYWRTQVWEIDAEMKIFIQKIEIRALSSFDNEIDPEAYDMVSNQVLRYFLSTEPGFKNHSGDGELYHKRNCDWVEGEGEEEE